MGIKLAKIRQTFPNIKIDNVNQHILNEIDSLNLKINRGNKIAVAVGSRGIDKIDLVVKTVCDKIKILGGTPFIVPSMGSHGGATAEGQIEVLESLGITEKSMGVPIKSSMEVVEIDTKTDRIKAYFDKTAYEACGVVVINRIKPHTDFRGPYESGIIKMITIGMGKHAGATEFHKHGLEGLETLMPIAANAIIKDVKFLFAVGIIENQWDEATTIKAIPANQFMIQEPELLEEAFKNMPSLPCEKIDVLIVKNIGKNISGTGMDPNIIGRIMIKGVKEPDYPKINKIITTDITPESHGNGLGVGFADVITKSLFEKLDLKAIYTNVKTSLFYERVKIPLMEDSDEDAYNTALLACGDIKKGNERVLYIKDTLHITEMYASKAIIDELGDKIEVLSEYKEIFENKNLIEI